MVRIFFIRHGETDWNREKRLMGWKETPLNDMGRRQAESLSRELASFSISALYSSPLKRTMETSEIIARPHSLDVIKEEGFIEVAFGPWEGRPFKELIVTKEYKQFRQFPKDFFHPEIERIVDVQKRAVDALDKMVKDCGEGIITVVSHCDVIRAVLAYYLKMDLNAFRKLIIDNASLSVLDFDADKIGLSLLNHRGKVEVSERFFLAEPT